MRHLLLLATCLTLTACAASPQHEALTPPSTRAAIADICRAEESSGALSGQVIVARNGRIIHHGLYGKASIELDIPPTDDTRFKLFSTTKRFTADAIMLLVRDGRLSTSDSIRTWFPEAPASWHPVTIHHLLTHTSGIPEFLDELVQHQHPTQLESVIATLAAIQDLAPITTPGTTFAYSNSGYTVLGALIERASGMAYPDFLRARIFTPAAMTSAGVETPVFIDFGDGPTDVGHHPIARLASGYNGAPDSPIPTTSNVYIITGAGAIHATATDLLHYDNALRTGAVIPLSLQHTMVDSAFDNPNGADVGYGWFIRERHGHQLISHSGGTNGFTCEYARIPDDGLCIIICANHGFLNPEALRDKFLDAIYGDDDLSQS